MQSVRKIPIQSRSVAGKIFSYKNNRMVSYESQLELAFIYHLEFSPEVRSYVEQPIKVYSNAGKIKTYYVPDFIVYYKDFNQKPLLAEIKYSTELVERKEYVERKVSALKRYADENNFEFRLITEKELLTHRLENYKFLYGYLPQPEHVINYPEYTEKIIEFLNAKQITTPQTIIDTLGKSLNEKASILTVIWHLVANNVLKTDLDKPLTNSCVLSLNAKNQNNVKALFFVFNNL